MDQSLQPTYVQDDQSSHCFFVVQLSQPGCPHSRTTYPKAAISIKCWWGLLSLSLFNTECHYSATLLYPPFAVLLLSWILLPPVLGCCLATQDVDNSFQLSTPGQSYQ